MESFLILCLIVVLLVRWFYMSRRFQAIESRLAMLSARLAGQDLALTRLDAMFPREDAIVQPGAWPVAPPAEQPIAEQAPAPPRDTPRSTAEWETLLGGNWLNKLGVFVLVVGIALALGYSFTRVGPLGRISTSLAVSIAMLVGGAVWERRETYRVFARGLMGGGWAALYITVFAMHSIDAARVIASPVAAFVLLLAVAVGMIAHSLRYHSQTVTGVSYFVAFGTLAIAEVKSLPLLALIPLAVSLLYVAHRFDWLRLVFVGLIFTYAISALRGDQGTPLWQAQAIFAIYWLLFEIFDILRPGAWLLPLNAAGFLGLSVLKWNSDAPDKLWIMLAASGAAYLASAVARSRSRQWQGALTLTAGLAAAAVFQKLDRQWVASALVVEAELFYLAGVRLGARYLRWLGTALFGLEVGRLLSTDIFVLPLSAWIPIASLDAVVFYANRALFAADSFFGVAAAGMLALIVGKEVSDPYRSIGWLLLAAIAFAFGWWRRLFDFRLQGYLLGALSVTAAVFEIYQAPLALAAAASYAAGFCALWSAPDRFLGQESKVLRLAGLLLGTLLTALLLYHNISGSMSTVAWGIQGAALLVAGFPLRDRVLRISGLALLLCCILKLFLWDLRHLDTLPRIFSFIVLGLILLGVSWVYTRYRERVSRFL